MKTRIVGAVPTRFQTPWRFYYRWVTRRLERELRFLHKLLDHPITCIDVGANYGTYTYLLRRICHRVEAFEPLPQCADALEAYFGESAGIHRVALSDEHRRSTLFVPVENSRANLESASVKRTASGAVALEVETRRLDDFHFRQVSFVKIDVEGHELSVLTGARETIAAWKPLLLVEIEQRHIDRPIEKVFARIEAMGYSGRFLEDGALRPINTFSYEKHQRPWLADPTARGYINNFFFLPTS